jgi:hypothetical protein
MGAILRNEPLEVTAEDGLRSLETALRTTELSSPEGERAPA